MGRGASNGATRGSAGSRSPRAGSGRRRGASPPRSRRLDAMLRDFLRFTRADRASVEPLRLTDLVDEVLAFAAPEFGLRGIRVHREYDAALGLVDADPMLLKQAVLNLIQNAQDAMA